MLVLAAIIAAAVTLFALEVFPVDKVSLLVLSALLGFGLISAKEAVAGFGNPATITVGCMLALSFGIERTGALNFVANKIVDFAAGSEFKVLVSMMVAVGALSAVINNTAAVAIFLPLTLAVAREQDLEASRLLMPMSFTAIFAGTCTLIGTSTNLLVYGVVQRQLGYSIGMFEMTPLGLVFFVVGAAYLLAVGRRLIPSRRKRHDLTGTYQLRHFVTEIVLPANSSLVGQTLGEARLGERYGLEVMEIWRDHDKIVATDQHLGLRPGDILLVQGDPNAFLQVQEEEKVRLKALALYDQDLEAENVVLVEAFISPGSRLVESTLKEIDLRRTYGVNALAIRRHGKTIREKIGVTRLQGGDCLLVLSTRENLDLLRGLPDFLLLEEVRISFLRRVKAYYAAAIFLGIITVAALEVLTVVGAALIGVGLMLLTGCIRLHELYQNISWTTLIMLGCLIPLGTAMENSGLAASIAAQVVGSLNALGPVAVLSGIYILTSLLTEVLSNNAAAVLMVPISLAVAQQLGVSPVPFVFAVMFAGSASFMTPVGYQTNTMIFGPGGYKFSDFIRVGAPLNVLFWLVATILIPLFWPF